MVVDTLVCTTTLLVTCMQVADKGRKSHKNLRNQLYTIGLGNDAYTPPDLGNIKFHGDRRCFLENVFVQILLKTGCALTCTCPKSNWILCVLGGNPLKDGNGRV